MKKLKTDRYLIISSAHLGMDDDILDVFSNVAKHYSAQVFHLGPLVTDAEYRSYQKVKTELERVKSEMQAFEYDPKYTPERASKLEEKVDSLKDKLEYIGKGQKSRIEKLKQTFPNVKFITTNQISLPQNQEKFIYDGLELSKYLFLAPIPPSGPNISGKPVQKRAVAYLKNYGRSWIAAHPIPSVQCYPRPGINQAYNFFTVGSLRHSPLPYHTKQQSIYSHMPAAVLVLVDHANGEFHPRQLHVDYLNDTKPSLFTKNRKTQPMVLDDGQVFLANKVLEVKSADKACAATDDHAPYEHPGALGALRGLNLLHKPETFINIGDAADFTSVCHHIKHSLGEREGLRTVDDLSALRKLLDAEINSPTIKKKILIDSNHHEWVSKHVMENPNLIGILDWETLAKNMLPDWDVFIRNTQARIYKWGDFTLRHGDQEAGVDGGDLMTENGKYLCGHWHQYRSHKRAISMGCLAKLSPSYLGGKQTAWQNQIASLTKYGEIAAVNVKIVLHDKKVEVSRFAYRGDIYEVPHHKLPHNYETNYRRIAELLCKNY